MRSLRAGLVIGLGAAAAGAGLARAEVYPDYLPMASLTGATEAQVSALVGWAAHWPGFRDARPASELTRGWGLEVGITTEWVPAPAAFASALSLWSGGSVAGGFVLPRLTVHKRLPWGLEAGLGLLVLPTATRPLMNVAGSLKKVLNPGGTVVFAGRAGFGWGSFWFIRTARVDLDLVASVPMGGEAGPQLDPYAMLGLHPGWGGVDIPASANLPVSTTAWSLQPVGSVGLPIEWENLSTSLTMDWIIPGGIIYGATVRARF